MLRDLFVFHVWCATKPSRRGDAPFGGFSLSEGDPRTRLARSWCRQLCYGVLGEQIGHWCVLS